MVFGDEWSLCVGGGRDVTERERRLPCPAPTTPPTHLKDARRLCADRAGAEHGGRAALELLADEAGERVVAERDARVRLVDAPLLVLFLLLV